MGSAIADVNSTSMIRLCGEIKLVRLSVASALFLLTLVGWPDFSLAQSEKAALRALEKLESEVEQGIAFQSYIRLLSSARKEINRLDSGGKVRTGSETFRYLKAAVASYGAAGEIWSAKFEKFDNPEYQRNHEWFLSVREFEEVSRRFPFLNDPELRRAEVIGGDPSFTNVFREAAVSALWREASNELDRARATIKQPVSP